jgi:hypothetical protein
MQLMGFSSARYPTRFQGQAPEAQAWNAPIPRRYPALLWRRPISIWTPVALLLALGWPLLALREEPGMAQMAAIVGALSFLAAAISIGAAWLAGRPPRLRRTIIAHLLAAGAIAAFASPFVFAALLDVLAQDEGAAGSGLPNRMAWALTPLALMLGLPIALFGGLVFSFVAFVKPKRLAPNELLLDSRAGEDQVAALEPTRDIERIA